MIEYDAFVVVKCMSKSLVKSAELYVVKCEHFLVFFFSIGHLNFNLCNMHLIFDCSVFLCTMICLSKNFDTTGEKLLHSLVHHYTIMKLANLYNGVYCL